MTRSTLLLFFVICIITQQVTCQKYYQMLANGQTFTLQLNASQFVVFEIDLRAQEGLTIYPADDLRFEFLPLGKVNIFIRQGEAPTLEKYDRITLNVNSSNPQGNYIAPNYKFCHPVRAPWYLGVQNIVEETKFHVRVSVRYNSDCKENLANGVLIALLSLGIAILIVAFGAFIIVIIRFIRGKRLEQQQMYAPTEDKVDDQQQYGSL